MANTKNPKLVMKFEAVGDPDSTGARSWVVTVNGAEVGRITKDTCWVGDGYAADSYTIELDVEGDDTGCSVCETFDVRNIWNGTRSRITYSARGAMAACKEVARDMLKKHPEQFRQLVAESAVVA